MDEGKVKHIGHLAQIRVYLGKMFRMFIYQKDWKLLPMAAIIAGAVAFVTGNSMFVTMEGTMQGSLALSCVCLWNGFFNSIQVVCRERAVIKREHRAGMHVSSYVLSHVIYQACLCVLQVVITIIVCTFAKYAFPTQGIMTPWFMTDFAISMFLITFAADMLSLFISCFVKSTTAAMTVMPFLLIFQLIFSGSLFPLGTNAKMISDLTVTKWGMNSICAESRYNDQPMVSVWNQIYSVRSLEFDGVKPVEIVTEYLEQNHLVDEFTKVTAQAARVEDYNSTAKNVSKCWSMLVSMSLVFMAAAVISLEFVDKDKR
ncbi:MAG: ABC transporter permease [Erysipelotrichia bacterium]|nr:ABC transporter permease [Erysipelotrichia bacterium]